MKICFLSPIGQLGGAERSLLDMIAGIRAARPDWHLSVVAGGCGPLSSAARGLGAKVIARPLSAGLARLGDWMPDSHEGPLRLVSLLLNSLRAAPGAVSDLRRLRRALASEAPDIIHTNGFKMHLLGVAAAPARARIIWHVHDYVSQRPLMARLMRRGAGRCAAAIANSMGVARDLRAICGPRLPIHTVYGGIDLERFAPCGPSLDLDRASGLPPAPAGTIRIGLIATFARWKGQAVFLRALAALPPDLGFRGYVIGGPIYQTSGSQYSRTELAGLADQLGLSPNVGFTGVVQDSAPALRALDIVVHASTRPEPFGLTIAEAMACGKPIVASSDAGACELITGGRDGILSAPGSVAALAQHLGDLARDGGLRAAIGREGRITATREFSRVRLARQILEVYRQTLPDGMER